MPLNCLVIKTSALGDVVQALSVIKIIKRQDSSVRVDWVVEKPIAPLLTAHPDINNVWVLDTKNWKRQCFCRDTHHHIRQFIEKLRTKKYDVVFDLQGNLKSFFITRLAKADRKIGFGFKTAAEWPASLFLDNRYNPPLHQNMRKDYQFLVSSYFHDFGLVEEEILHLKMNEGQANELKTVATFPRQSPLWMICPGSRWPNKQLRVDTLIELLQKAYEEFAPYFVFTSGSKEEHCIAERLHGTFPHSTLVHGLSFSALQNVMGLMHLVISMDSFPLHLAATTKAATFSVFGASSARKYAPVGQRHFSYQGECPYGKTFEKRCPILRSCTTGACIHDLGANSLYLALKKHWQEICSASSR